VDFEAMTGEAPSCRPERTHHTGVEFGRAQDLPNGVLPKVRRESSTLIGYRVRCRDDSASCPA
jgi:hypothetical protein